MPIDGNVEYARSMSANVDLPRHEAVSGTMIGFAKYAASSRSVSMTNFDTDNAVLLRVDYDQCGIPTEGAGELRPSGLNRSSEGVEPWSPAKSKQAFNTPRYGFSNRVRFGDRRLTSNAAQIPDVLLAPENRRLAPGTSNPSFSRPLTNKRFCDFGR